ncbi:MAG: type I 3-dehydroquinate dehydratase [Treponema sp.]|jgi:3-dehydroquinate dehydratase/shikimate dehydrogenase|nr:type I 3-dehydroquinate dehydratase [Treponema sp.]
MAKICLCLTGKTLARDLEILAKYRRYADIAELRVDCLEPDERLMIRRFPEQAGLPVILTIRRTADGGFYSGGEGARINLLSRGLAFAEADRRRNFAYVDIEEDLNVPSLEEAARTFGTRIIRSCHDINGAEGDLAGKIQSLCHAGDEMAKLAVTPRSLADVIRIVRAAGETADIEKVVLGMGHFGMITRILAEQTGSRLSYASPGGEKDIPPAAPGQIDVRELAELYRFRDIGVSTKIYGVTGYPLTVSDSPRFFNAVFAMENTNAVYVPVPADSAASLLELAEELGFSGLSVTVPYKEAILSMLAQRSAETVAIGACNTIVNSGGFWTGFNTDARGFSDSLLDFLGLKNLKRRRVTIIGAGGAARAVAFEVHRLGGRALILNRTVVRARDLASVYKFRWGGLDSQGLAAMGNYSDIIINTTPAGMEGNAERDPLPSYVFHGREQVMDLVYRPEVTPLLQRALAAGCRIKNGRDMLIRQACFQYAAFMGKELSGQLVSRVIF